MLRPNFKIALIILISFASLFYLWDLGAAPLDDYDEATYAQVVKETLKNGNWLTFTYFGETWIDKPPLQFWLMTLSAKLFGLNEFSLRLPSALTGILSTVFVFLITREITKNNLTALAAGTALTLFPLFLSAGRDVRLEVPVTAAILNAIYFYLKGLTSPKYLIGIGTSIGIGILIKSVFGLLAVPFLIFWSTMAKNWSLLKNKFFWLGIAAGAAIALPWHVYEIIKLGTPFWQNYFEFHITQRLTENIFSNQISNYEYLAIFFRYGFPWTILFLVPLALAVLNLISRSFRLKMAADFLPLAGFTFSAALIIAGFLIVPSKLMTYLIPIYPLVILSLFISLGSLKSLFTKAYKILIALFAVTFLIAGYLTIKEVFFNPQLFTLDFSQEEKEIGLYLKNNAAPDEKVFAISWPHHQTLRYYAEKDIQQLRETGLNISLPFWLVVPSQLMEKYPAMKKFSQSYQGQYLTLVHFQK